MGLRSAGKCGTRTFFHIAVALRCQFGGVRVWSEANACVSHFRRHKLEVQVIIARWPRAKRAEAQDYRGSASEASGGDCRLDAVASKLGVRD